MTLPSLEDQIQEYKRVRRRHRCLHPEASRDACSRQHSSSHSLSRRQSLARIARSGQVYAPITDYGQFHVAGGQCLIRLQSIRQVSTFSGFCAKHDSSLFRLLDTSEFNSTKEYAALFAYRTICYEVASKLNGLALIPFLRRMARARSAEPRGPFERFLAAFEIGLRHGLDNLKRHKETYELILNSQHFDAVRFVAFFSNLPPNVLVSSVLYPDFDFAGAVIQRLDRREDPLDLLSFGAVPHASGTVALLVWERSSDRSCRQLVGSLARLPSPEVAVPNALLNLLLSASGNLAIRPGWWESLTEQMRIVVAQKLHSGANPKTPVNPSYLSSFAESPLTWQISHVRTNVQAVV